MEDVTLSPQERLTRWRQTQPPVEKPRRPQPYTPTAEEQAELDAIPSTTARVTRWREMQAAAQRQGGGG